METAGSDVRRTIVIGAAAAAAAVAIGLAATRHGVGVGDDATVQLSAGLNLARGHGLNFWNGEALTGFPPGVSVVAALGDLVGLGPEWSMRIANVAAFAVAAGLAVMLLRRHVESWVNVVVGAVAVVTTAELVHMIDSTTSEPIFIALCLGFILALEDLAENRDRLRPIIGIATITWAAFMFRYSGLGMVGIAAVVAILPLGGRPWRRRVVDATLVGAASLVVPVAWMLRNRSIDGDLMGNRPPSTDTLVGTLKNLLETLGEWTLPFATDDARERLIGLAVILVVAVPLIWLAVRGSIGRAQSGTDEAADESEEDQPKASPRRSILPLACFFCGYAGWVVAAQLSTAIAALGTRYLSPVLIPGLILLVVAIDRMPELLNLRLRPAARIATSVALAAFVLVNIPQLITEVRSVSADKLSYVSDEWKTSDLTAEVTRLPTSADVYSNNPFGVWWTTRRELLQHSPAATYANRSGVKLKVSKKFIDSVSCKESYLVWFDGPGDYYSPDELRTWVDLQKIYSDRQGAVYRIGSRDKKTTRC